MAGLPWQQTMYSLDTHYPVSMTHDPPGVGDTISLAKNEHLFLEGPILGEIDWTWKWASDPKPRGDNYKIDIFDLTRAADAYCTRDDGAYDPKYFNGAGCDPTDLCHIGIFDLVTITSAYGKTFSAPPA